MMGYGTKPDPSGRAAITYCFYYNICYYCCLLTQPRGPTRCSLHYFGLGLVEITPNWAWPIEVRGGPYPLYKEVFTSLLG
ncbi:hypothetical protein HanHA89_Chr14g0568051 [Helianthus annuus]|nr:hypothetical protein HanHA89_Chr14g0568051 [Helianthus annuus]